jgi:DNA-binding GntR family transcriptional regulator
VLAASLKAEQNAHAATASQLAAARAEITQAAGLREQVTVLTAKLAAAQATADDLAASRQKANQLTDQVAELRAKYEAAPPAGSGISAVSGYVTSDGVFHAALPDAQHHAAVLGLMADANLSAAAAEALIGKRERIIAHLAPLGAAAPAPAKSAT